jgi:hypothetical protein
MMRVPLRGGESTEVTSDYIFFNHPLLTDTAVIFHAQAASDPSEAILSFPLSGGPPTTILSLPTGDGFGDGFASDGRFLYFSDSHGLEALPLTADAGPSDMVTLVAGAETNGMGVFGKELVFLVPHGPEATSVGKVQSVPLPPRTDAVVTMLGMSGPSPWGFTTCGSDACWLDDGTHALESFAPSSGKLRTIVQLAGPFAEANAFVFDGTDVYLSGCDASCSVRSIVRIPADGGCAAVLVTMPPSDYDSALAVDDECIYWANADGIFSLAKSVYEPSRQ